MRPAPRHGDVAEDGQRHVARHDVARQVAEEGLVSGRLELDQLPERARELYGAAYGAKVEVDASGQHVLRAGFAHPAGKIPLPHHGWLAPPRIRRHRVAGAPRKPDTD